MNITNLLDMELKHVASTSGGEYAGACPFCGGVDRFRAWPETDRAWCRQCGWKGDSIQFVRDTKGATYHEACHYLSIEPKTTTGTTTGFTWQPKPPKPAPGEVWQQRCQAFLKWTQQQLQGNDSVINWLTGERGLFLETIRAAGLGYNPRQFYRDRQEFGLDPDVNANGKPKKVWLPAGLVLPCFGSGGRLMRLRIRRDQIGPNDDRYILAPGGNTRPMMLGDAETIVIVESELDALLINQLAGDLVSVIALGNAQIRPDAETDKRLRQAGLILNALDSDAAGAKEAWGFWHDNYGAKRWPCIRAKDPTEMIQAGVDLRQWILAGLPEVKPEINGIEPLTTCLHSRPCPHLQAPGGQRPVCRVNGGPIFDFEQCPKGLWFEERKGNGYPDTRKRSEPTCGKTPRSRH